GSGVAVSVVIGDLSVFADESPMLGMRTNLLANAVKHTPSGGSARVEAQLSDDTRWVTVRVCDTGPGIPTVDAAHVFDRFYQTAGGRSRGGSGLGLAFCKLAVELHGGTIRA